VTFFLVAFCHFTWWHSAQSFCWAWLAECRSAEYRSGECCSVYY